MRRTLKRTIKTCMALGLMIASTSIFVTGCAGKPEAEKAAAPAENSAVKASGGNEAKPSTTNHD